jgi:signal transduction histidine kinase
MMLPHELRTPLNGILAYGEMLQAEAGTLPAEEVAEMGQVIYESGKRLERLIENFLIYSQLEILGTDSQKLHSLRKERTEHPMKVVDEHARGQAQLASRAGDLSLELADQPIPMSEAYLAKIVDELVQNAFKFSTKGTPVRVALSDLPDAVVLSISDTGRGFPQENLAKIGAYMQFDRRLHEQQGLGLGLAIAKRLTELHGGTLLIQSEPGKQTIVSVKMPKGNSA